MDPGSPPRGNGPRVAAGLEEDADALARLPLEDRVSGHVGEEQESPAPIPDRSLGPVEPVRDPLDARLARDDRIEPGIETLDRAERRHLLLLGVSDETREPEAAASPAAVIIPRQPCCHVADLLS